MALVLRRRPNEWVRIETVSGEVIRVGVKESGRYAARLIFDCDPAVKLTREELLTAPCGADAACEVEVAGG